VELPEKFAALGLTYDDVLLLPGQSDLAPADIDTTARLTRELTLRVPLISRDHLQPGHHRARRDPGAARPAGR
jgi:hypothetical protein